MGSLIMAADGSFVDPAEKPQPSPQEVIAAAGEQRPGIEEQDINDGWLIEQTQPIDDGNGLMHYKIVLPDGGPFECTPFQIEHRRDMTKVWMGAVRQEIVNRANAALEVTKAAALKARREKQMQGAGILVSDTMPTPQEAAALAAAVKTPPPSPPESARAVIAEVRATRVEAPPAPSTDPLEYAQQQLEQAEAELAHWGDLARKAARQQKAAQKAALKWKTVIEAFSDSDKEAVVVESVDKPSGSRAERMARTLRTSATANSK